MTRRESLAAGLAAVAAGAVAGRWASATATAPPQAPAEGQPPVRPDEVYLFVTSSGDDANSGMQWAESLATIDAALRRLGTSVGTVMLAPGDALTVQETIELDVSRHRIVGDRSTIVLADTGTGLPLIRCRGSALQPLHQPWAVLEGVELQGPTRDGDHVGIAFETRPADGKPAAAHIEIRNVSVHDFGTGVSIGDNSYCLTFSNCMVGKCGTCVLIPDVIVNAGERIEFSGSTIFDSEVGLDVRSRAAEIYFLGSSLDYCRTLATIEDGQIHAVSSHLEFDRSRADPPLRVSGTSGAFSMVGGKLTGVTKSQEMSVTAIVANDASSTGGASFAHVWMTNLSTTTGDFSSGAGHTSIVGELTSEAPHRSFTVVGEANNLLLDGSFAQKDLVDDWLWENASGVLTPIDRPTILSLNGGSGLSITPATAGTGEAVTLVVPATSRGLARCRYSLTASDDAAGQVEVSFRAGRLAIGRTPRTVGLADLGSATAYDVPDLRRTWTVGRSPLPVRRLPSGATHIFLTLRPKNVPAGSTVAVGAVNVCVT